MLKQQTLGQYIKNYLNDNSLNYESVSFEDMTLDIAAEVADIILHDKHPDTQHLIPHEYENCLRFTEESQDLFNRYYDETIKYLENKNATLK